jgi:hypothetical protein
MPGYAQNLLNERYGLFLTVATVNYNVIVASGANQPMNSVIEIHDSYLTSIAKLGDLLELRFRAYIHKSEGIPGVDAGTGWTQDVILVLGNGTIDGSITQWPADLYDGTLEIDGEASENIVPIPLDRKGTVQLTLKPKSDEPIVVRGNNVRLELRGVATYVEEFPGSTTA